MPQALRERIAESAAEAGRSFNGEVLHRLTWSLEHEAAQRGQTTRGKGELMSRTRMRTVAISVATAVVLAAVLVGALVASSSTTPNRTGFKAPKGGDPDASAVAKIGGGTGAGKEESRSLGTADEWAYAVRAYPSDTITATQSKNAHDSFMRFDNATHPKASSAVGQFENFGPTDRAVQPGVLNFYGATDETASRTKTLAISSTCTPGSCTLWAGAAGGGLWRTNDALSSNPAWQFLSTPFQQNALGYIALDPTDKSGKTLYVGTGEASQCGSGCQAGAGIWKTTNGGNSWTKLADSCVSNATFVCVTPATDAFLGRGIAKIIVDPKNPHHLLVASAVAIRGMSSIVGLGGQASRTDPTINTPGLYESTDGGATFTPTFLLNTNTAGPPAPGRRGALDLALDPTDERAVYVTFNDGGVWRRCATVANTTCGGETSSSQFDFKQIWKPRNPLAGTQGVGAPTDNERTSIALTVKNGKTRIYLITGQVESAPGATATNCYSAAGSPCEAPASFWRLDNANQPSATLLAGEPAVPAFPPAGNGNPYPAVYNNWQILTAKRNPGPIVSFNDVQGDRSSPYWATYNFCTSQCWYDQWVVVDPTNPDHVGIGGSYVYDEGPCYTKGVNCGNEDSNNRAVLISDTAGDPDPNNNNRTFTDVTADATNQPEETQCAFAPLNFPCLYAFGSIHPDQHAFLFNPSNSNQFFESSDGGIARTNGHYTDASNLCSQRAITGDDLTSCQRVLSKIPVQIQKNLNTGGYGNTLQFINVEPNPSNSCEVIGGTQDNGTWLSSEHCSTPDRAVYTQTIYGDGGNAGWDVYPDQATTPTGKPWMFNQFTGGATDANFQGGDPIKWVIISGSPTMTAQRGCCFGFYWPEISDPNPPLFNGVRTHPIFTGGRSLFRSWAFGAGRPISNPQQTQPAVAFYEANCQEFFVGSTNPNCGDFQPLGVGNGAANSASDLTGTFYNYNDPAGPTARPERLGGAISYIARRAGDTDTVWVATSTGRLFVSHNANASDITTVTFRRVDNASSPSRFPDGIYPSPTDAGVAYVAYSGFNSTPASPQVDGHLFRVSEGPGLASGVGTFVNLNVENGGTNQFPTPNGTGDLPVTDVAADDSTTINSSIGAVQTLYGATDFGVVKGVPNASGVYTWSVVGGLPRVQVTHLAIVPGQRSVCRQNCPAGNLYAATHALGIWLDRLR
jgi:hypothetical protein